MNNRPQLLIFDVNETLLALTPIQIAINKYLRSEAAFDHWFSKLLQFSLVETLTGEYRDFGDIGAATLKMTAQKFSVEPSEEKIREILGQITHLNPHPEVPGALKKLKESGYRIVTLTNGGQKTLEQQIRNSGLAEFFDALYSVEAVQKFKPHPATYRYVLEKEKVDANKAMLIAAHAWDVTGAQRAGLQSAFIERKGKFLYPIAEKPNLTGKTLQDIAEAL